MGNRIICCKSCRKEIKNELVGDDDCENKEIINYQNYCKFILKIVRIQSFFRGFLARKLYNKLIAEQSSYNININKKISDKEFITPEKMNLMRKSCTKEIVLSEVYFKDGSVFKGTIVNGRREGFGMQFWNNGSKYVGEFIQDKACGKGKLFKSNGDIFVGEFRNDKANGF